jgi:hypothetical protein
VHREVCVRKKFGKASPATWLALAAWAGCGFAGPARAADVTLDGTQTGRTFAGLGAVSAGAASRLLVDYPEPQRSEILDFLFKPNYGAALQHLKVEIGGDVNSTDGCEPSHQHTRYETNFTRGYEWWLMQEASARNPNVMLDCLAWGAPGWIGNGNYWSQDMADYVVNFINGAKQVYGLDLAFTGVRNEVINNPNWIITLRNTLNAAGLANVKIVAGDEWGGTWKIVDDIAANPALSNAVYAIGVHYPSHVGYTSPPIAKTFSQPLWASEEGTGGATWARALSLAKLYNRNYIVGKMTKSEIWSPVTAYYDLLAAAGSGLMRANSPWSGHYTVSPAIWATAHTTQFASPGWKYLEGGGNGLLPGGGSYVTLVSTNSSDFSIIIETADASAAQSVTFHLTGGLSAGSVRVWRTSSSQPFIHIGDAAVAGGAFSLALDPGCIYTLTTTTGQVKGATTPPAARAFPIPYRDDFESYAAGATPRYFSDQSGIFEIVPRADGRGHCLRQVTTQSGIEWAAQSSPYTILGDANWRDYEVSTEVLLETNGEAYLYGRIADIPGFSDPVPRAYWLKAGSSGAWELHNRSNTLASGRVAFPTNVWHRLKLIFAGDNIKAAINGVIVADVQDTAHANGMVGIGCGRHRARFDHFLVAARHRGPMNLAPGASATASSFWQNDATYAASKANDGDETTRWNAAGNDQNGAWLQLDFGSPTMFNRTRVSQFGDRITAFKIQSWTGSAWQDQVVSTSNLGPSRVDVFPPVTASKVRLFITSATNVPSIYEFAVSYEPPQPNLALAATASASSFWNNDPTYAAGKANDNDLSTRWNAAASEQTHCWLQLDFGAPTTFNKTTLRQFLDRVTGYQIQYWTGNAWATAFTGGQLGSVRTDVFPPVTASKVRFHVTGATNIPSIYEFQVFNDATLARSVYLNEWMTANTTLADPKDGDYESWFELFNAGNQAVDLAGWHVSNNPLNRFQFQIPSGFTLPPRGFLLAWADNEPSQNTPCNGDLHVNFQLAGAACLGLYTPDGEQMDLVELGDALPGASYGSRADGVEPILQTVAPTPRASNAQIKIKSLAAEQASGRPVATLSLDGIPETPHRIWTANDLTATNWTGLDDVLAHADGSFQFTDVTPAGAAKRFYRASTP